MCNNMHIFPSFILQLCLFLCCLSLSPVQSCLSFPSFICPTTPHSLSPNPPSHSSFPQSPSDIRVYFPPGRMHDRGAGGTLSKWQIFPSIRLCVSHSLCLSLHLCPATGPPQPCFPPPSSTFPSYLTTLIFKSAQAAFHLLSTWRSRQNHQGRKTVGWCPHPDFRSTSRHLKRRSICSGWCPAYIWVTKLWSVMK